MFWSRVRGIAVGWATIKFKCLNKVCWEGAKDMHGAWAARYPPLALFRLHGVHQNRGPWRCGTPLQHYTALRCSLHRRCATCVRAVRTSSLPITSRDTPAASPHFDVNDRLRSLVCAAIRDET